MVAQYQTWRGRSKAWHELTHNRLSEIYRKLGWSREVPQETYFAIDAMIRLGYEPASGLAAMFSFVEECIDEGLLAAPPTIMQEYAWGFNAMLELAVVLESQRRFAPFHRWHRQKQTEAEMKRDHEAAGLTVGDILALYQTPVETLLQFDFNALELPVARIVREIIAEKLDV